MKNDFFLEMEHIYKDFSGNVVLKDINLKVSPGEIVALVGENGAGKSTLMNILFGMPVIHQTGGFKGSIKVNGNSVEITSPQKAMQLGIGMVHQEFMLIDGFDVAENIKLNRENLKPSFAGRIFGKRLNLLNRQAMYKDSQLALDTLSLEINKYEKVGDLAVGYKQFIEISRELDKKDIQLIVLDEPTAVLTETEAQRFIDCVKSVADRGIAFIFISHRLEEVKKLCDRIIIMRDGEEVGDFKNEEISVLDISRMMVGREVSLIELDSSRLEESFESKRRPIVEIRNLSVDMVGEKTVDVSLSIQEGEIFGIGGLAGHGKASIANGILGLRPAEGEVLIAGTPINLKNTYETLQKGIAFVSEDRRNVGLALEETIEMNIAIGAMRLKNDFTKRFMGIRFYDHNAASVFTKSMIHDLDIRCTGEDQLVGRLSGGNQQKVCIARALASDAKILLVSEPTRGIDIGAKKTILETIIKLNRERGVTVIMTSSELAELRAVCDRIAIITEGKVAGILHPNDDDSTFGMLMSGESIDKNGLEAR